MVSVQEFGKSLAGHFSLGVFHAVAVVCQLGWLGLEDLLLKWFTHMAGRLVLIAGWGLGFFLHGPLYGASSCHGSWLPTERMIQQMQAEAAVPVVTYLQSHFWHILFVVQSQPWFTVGGDYARPWITSDHPRGWSPQPPFYWWLFNLFPRNIIIPSISVPCLKYFPVVSEVGLPNYFSKRLLYLFNFQISLWEYTFPSPSPILSVCNYFNLC